MQRQNTKCISRSVSLKKGQGTSPVRVTMFAMIPSTYQISKMRFSDSCNTVKITVTDETFIYLKKI